LARDKSHSWLTLISKSYEKGIRYPVGLVLKKDRRSFAEKSPLTLKCILKAVNRELETSLGNGYEIESGLFSVCLSSQDAREGLDAFIEKRRPNFKGK
jgi:enoyl-CoA hydratase/carnithine racemase